MSIELSILLTGVLTAAAAALTGTILTVRGQAMLTDAMSHGVVFGIAVFYLALGGVPDPVRLVSAAAAGLLTALASEALASSGRVKPDAGIALVFPAMFAAGVLLIGLFAKNAHIDVHTVLLGEIGFVWLDAVPLLGLQVPRPAIVLAASLAATLAFYLPARRALALAAFDPQHARLQGQRPALVTRAWLVLTAITAVAAFDAVGVVLYLAFALVPAVTGLLTARRLPWVLVVALGSGVAAALAGYPIAVRLDASIGGAMALATAVPLGLALAANAVARRAPRRKERS